MSFAFQEVTRFPPNTVAIKIAMALAVGMLVGFERESANMDVGTRTFGLTALLGTLSVLISPLRKAINTITPIMATKPYCVSDDDAAGPVPQPHAGG